MEINPFSSELINGAVQLVIEKTNEAVKASNGSLEAANRLVWDWCQSDPALRLAYLRIVFNENAVRMVSQVCCDAKGLTLAPAKPQPKRWWGK